MLQRRNYPLLNCPGMLPFPKINFSVYFKGLEYCLFQVKLNLGVCFKSPGILLIPMLNFTSGCSFQSSISLPETRLWYTAYSIAEFYCMFTVPGIRPNPMSIKCPGILPIVKLNFTCCLRALEYCQLWSWISLAVWGPWNTANCEADFYFLFEGPGILPVARLNFTFCFRALEYCLDVEKLNLSAIRTVRVLRPLRAINRIPSKPEKEGTKNIHTHSKLWE